jgi:type I restriction enzyme M protein
VFPWLREFGGEASTYSTHMKDARFTIQRQRCCHGRVDMLDGIPMTDRDTKVDLYEYNLSKIASAGQNGHFRTPRHIIEMMVEMTAPTPRDDICDPSASHWRRR